MIHLEIEKYCHECPEFDADVSKLTANGEVIDTVIQCAHSERCRTIKAYLEKQKERQDV